MGTCQFIVLFPTAPSRLIRGGDDGTCCQDITPSSSSHTLCYPFQPPPLLSQTKPNGCSIRAKTTEVHSWISLGNCKNTVYSSFRFMNMKLTFWETSRSLLPLCALTRRFLLLRDVSWNTVLSFLKAVSYFNQSLLSSYFRRKNCK